MTTQAEARGAIQNNFTQAHKMGQYTLHRVTLQISLRSVIKFPTSFYLTPAIFFHPSQLTDVGAPMVADVMCRWLLTMFDDSLAAFHSTLHFAIAVKLLHHWKAHSEDTAAQ